MPDLAFKNLSRQNCRAALLFCCRQNLKREFNYLNYNFYGTVFQNDAFSFCLKTELVNLRSIVWNS
jgi:hypothetical protein